MDILGKLLGNPYRAKVLRLFYLSPNKTLASKEIARLAKAPASATGREIKLLCEVGFLEKSSRHDEFLKKSKRGHKIERKKVDGFKLSATFPLLLALKYLVVTASPVSREKMLKFFKSGGVKVVILGGVFNKNFAEKPPGGLTATADGGSQLDMLIVGNGFVKSSLDVFIAKLGSEVGRELTWASMSAAEFEHRLSMHDKLLRDLFDYPHEFLVDKMGLSAKDQESKSI